MERRHMANGYEKKSMAMNSYNNFIAKYREQRDELDLFSNSSIESRDDAVSQYHSTKSKPVSVQVQEIIPEQPVSALRRSRTAPLKFPSSSSKKSLVGHKYIPVDYQPVSREVIVH